MKAVLILTLFTRSISAEGPGNPMTGPLYGKNYYLPHLPVYSFPGFSPVPGDRGDWSLSLSYTVINEFTVIDSETRVLDYESSAADLSLTWRLRENLLLGVDSRIISYYGGILDPLIEGWHSLFGFPNGGREYFSENDVFVHVQNGSGQDMSFSTPRLGLGDMDLYGVWTFYNQSCLTMAAAGAIKLPTGSFSHGTGSDFLDGGCQFLLSWRFHESWYFHFQQGFVFPGDLFFREGEGYASLISSQTFLVLQFMPRTNWAFLVQGRINTSPLFSDQVRLTEFWGAVPLFTLPQTSLQAGFKITRDSWSCQAYFEEDPLTHEGADILFSLRITRFLEK